MSRNPHEPTDETRNCVRTSAAVGVRQEDIAFLLDISEKTLRHYYRTELDEGLAEANTAIVAKLHAQIEQGNTAATIFADKCLRNRKKKVVQLEKPATPKKDWARIAAEDRYVSKGCGPERCAEALIEITIYRLGISTVESLSDDDIRKNILQMEVQIKITEKEVETLVPRYEI